jgi:hypothetical protein
MNCNLVGFFTLTATLCTVSAYAGQPVFTTLLHDGTLREMDLIILNVVASDPNGHSLQYDWSITNDETGGKAFFKAKYGASAEFAVQWVSSSSAGSLNGKKITLQVIARHANTLDGTEEAVTTATYTVQGVNHPPIPVISGKLGTPTDRIPTGYGVCADAYQSEDPDGDSVRGDWGWGSWSGGRWKNALGNYPPVLIGSEGGRCCFTVLDMTAPIDQNIELTLSNGLHVVKTVATCYLKPADVPPPNSAPTITFLTNPVLAVVGFQAQLVADVEDIDGDALEYTFVLLLDNSTVPSSAMTVTTLSGTKKRVAVSVSAATAGTFDYRLTARETSTSDHKTASATISLIVTSNSPNTPPVAKIQYMIGSSGYLDPPATPVTVESSSAVTVSLKGDTSTDDGGTPNLTYAWARQSSLIAGSTTLGSITGATTTLQIAPHTQGTVTVTLTARDQGNLSDSTQISFEVLYLNQKPIARATATVGSETVSGAVDEGTVVQLDGSASSRPDDSTTGLTHQWTQTEGPAVILTDADKAVASFVAPAATDSASQLKFKLIVSDGTTLSDPVELTIALNQPNLYFSQVAVGPLGSAEFRSCLLLVNGTSEAANGVEVKFFGQDGNPMDVTINGAPWDGQPFNIPALSSERLLFTGEDLKVGWAKVKAGIQLTGVMLYQIVGENEDIQAQVGLYSTQAATKFATFYDPAVETAIAVANPTAQPAQIQVRIIDNKTGGEVISKSLFDQDMGGPLPGMNHAAKFLTPEFFGQLPLTFGVGTLLVESDVPVAVTILQTKGGVVFSTLPVRTVK